jgi:hypothetical protein
MPQKDERAHDEILGDLDDRIKKISQSYDKKNKKPDPNTALMSHEVLLRMYYYEHGGYGQVGVD